MVIVVTETLNMQHCLKSELDLFQSKPVQTSIIDSHMVGYKSISPANESVLEFTLPKSTEHYRDLSSVYLKLDVKMTGWEPKTEKAASINNLLHSLFSQIKIELNGKTVEGGDNYPYRCFIESLLNYGTDAASTHLTTNMFYLDDNNLDADDKNSGFMLRKEKLEKGIVELYGKLHADLFHTPLLLALGTELRIRLTRSNQSFVTLSSIADSKVKFDITDATLYVKNVTPAPAILLAHTKTLAMGANIRYNIKRVEVRSHTISSHESSCSLDNCILGQLPSYIVVGFLKNDAYSGKANLNSLKFEHFDYNHFALKVNGVQIPSDALTPNWTEGRFARCYNQLYCDTHVKNNYQSNLITPNRFANGYHFLAFDLTPDNAGTQSHASLSRQGSVRIDVRFAKPLPNAVTVIVYAAYDNTIEIDKTGTVFTDY